MTTEVETFSEVLPPGTHAAAEARRVLRLLLDRVEADELMDQALLATSELVTNALIHAGPVVELRAQATPGAVRVEVIDASPHAPAARDHAVTSSTGRGLRLVEQMVDRWGITARPGGKSVWFELGDSVWSADQAGSLPTPAGPPDRTVTLTRFPVLMHWAWQEHASALLREYLLYASEADASVLERHAHASDALDLLREQVPPPALPEDPDALLDVALEPDVTAPEVRIKVPQRSVPHFQTLSDLLDQATLEASRGRLLSPQTQPEIKELRRWLCQQVASQSAGSAPSPWRPRTEVTTALGSTDDLARRYAELAETPGAMLAINAVGVIVAVSPLALRFLGYDTSADLIGRRILVVIPARYHQAHIAGTTLNATNGRDTLLGVSLTLPMVLADGREQLVRLLVRSRLLDSGETVFVATFDLAAPD